MAHKSTRRHVTVSRTRVMTRVRGRWIPPVLAAAALVAGTWMSSRNTDWEADNREERRLGLAAELDSQPLIAEKHFLAALRHNKYDWETHLSLATIEHHWNGNFDHALSHYLLALAYCPEPGQNEELSRQIALVTLLRDGALENPYDALTDMFAAVEEDSLHLFRQRLVPTLETDFEEYWDAWRKRGRGKPFYQYITPLPDGSYDAAVEVTYPDRSNLLIRLSCHRHDIWRLALSFP